METFQKALDTAYPYAIPLAAAAMADAFARSNQPSEWKDFGGGMANLLPLVTIAGLAALNASVIPRKTINTSAFRGKMGVVGLLVLASIIVSLARKESHSIEKAVAAEIEGEGGDDGRHSHDVEKALFATVAFVAGVVLVGVYATKFASEKKSTDNLIVRAANEAARRARNVNSGYS